MRIDREVQDIAVTPSVPQRQRRDMFIEQIPVE